MELTQDQVWELLSVMTKHNSSAVVDWTNRTIRVLSEVKVNPEVELSDGPMTYQDVLFEIRG